MSEIEQLRADLERVQKQAAAMRQAIREIQYAVEAHPNLRDPDRDSTIAARCRAITQFDAGRSYVHRDQVKPLVEALQKAENAIQRSAGINDETRLGWALKDVDAALDHARKLGFPTTQPTPNSGGALTRGPCVEGAEMPK